MSIRRFEQQMETRESVEKNLKDSGYKSPQEVIDKSKDVYYQKEGILIASLLDYLGEDRKQEDAQSIERFKKTSDNIERLEILKTLSIPDAIKCLKNYSNSGASWRYFEGRLEFYRKLIQGKATRKQNQQKWDSNKGEYVDVVREYQIDATNSTPETIRTGILRDVEFAAMLGTPELGIYKVVEKRLVAKNATTKHLLPALKGFNSGIGVGSGRWLTRYLYLNLENSDDRAQSERIGYGYTFLRKLYEESKALVIQRHKGEPLDDKALEHRAVIQAANWLEEATTYNDPNRPLGSPYIGSIQESIAWARLGDPKVKKQLRGMRVKIQESDLRNIERFIGKSGSNRYQAEKKKLNIDVNALKDYIKNDTNTPNYYLTTVQNGTEIRVEGREAANLMTEEENKKAIERAKRWFEREMEKINRWFEKSKIKIAGYDIPEAERDTISANVQKRYEEKIAYLQRDYQNETERLKNRTPEELLQVLQKRQEIVDRRFEKRKSLAQKALDLHFHFNHEGSAYGSKPLAGLVDWINYAPFRIIKRAHKMLNQKAGEDEITTYALADIIAGNRGTTGEDIRIIKNLVQKAKEGVYEAKQKLENISKVANIVSRFNYEVSLTDIEDMASKNFYGMAEALKLYDLKQVRQFMNQGVNLDSIATIKTVTQKFGHDLAPAETASLASHNINDFEKALYSFDLSAVKTLLEQNVNLLIAIEVLNNTKRFGYELSISQIATLTKNISSIEDFSNALRNLKLEEVEKMFSVGLSYENFKIVESSLKKHELQSNFNSILSVAQKLIKKHEYHYLDRALEFYSLQEVEQIIANGAPLRDTIQIRQALEEKQITSNLQETITFTKASEQNFWYFDECINTFGIENVRKMAAKSCSFRKVIEANNYINSQRQRSSWGGKEENEMPDSTREALRKGGVDVIISIAKADSIEAAMKTLAAGFSVEEVTRFPYLISSLVSKL